MPTRNYWQGYTPTVSLDGLAEFNRQKEIEKENRLIGLKHLIETQGRQIAEENIKDYLTESNDNAWVEYNYTQPKAKNKHLHRQNVDKMMHTKEDVEAMTLGGIAPLAVMSAPLWGPSIIAGGDALASSALGKVITKGITNPYTNAFSTSAFGAHGLNHAINEGINGWGDVAITALEMVPITQVVKPVWNTGNYLVNNYKDVKALNNFINKYDYSIIKPKISLMFNDKKLDDTFDYIVKRHNTFSRGIDPYETQKFGRLLDLSPEEAARYSLTHIPKVYKGNNAGLLPNENGLYLSNSFNTAAGYTNQGNGYIGIVRRPIKYGQTTRRDFLHENDFIFSRPPGTAKQFFTTTDDPNNAWIYRNYKGFNRHKKIKDKEVNWEKSQPYEIRANAGAKIIERSKDPNYRHYIIVGEEGQQPVELIHMYKPKIIGSKAHDNISSVSLSRKK